MHALRPRRGTAEQQQRTAQRGALHGHLAGVIAGIALVLVGGVVLLVDDDQPKSLDRREHGRAGPTQTRASPVRSRRHSS